MTTERRELGMVVNYFCRSREGAEHPLIVRTTELGLRWLQQSEVVGTILLVDGSPEPDPLMRQVCEELGVRYDHAGRQLTYVESYNRGWRALTEPFVGLMANDILPHPPETLSILLEWIRREEVGCAFPYMTTHRAGCDETQRPGFWRRGSITCEPSSMTLNLNLFKRSTLEAIGGLDEGYVYGYGEPILIIRIRELNQRVVMVGGTRIFHLDRLTKDLGQSALVDADHGVDTERWYREFPDHASRRGLANLRLWRWPFSTTWKIRTLWWLHERLPVPKLRDLALALILWVEPRLTRYPTRRG